MVNNFAKVRHLLEFRSDDDFYFLQVIQRKKDHGKGKIAGTNNNSRLIKAYYIRSLEYYDSIIPEVKTLCEVFGARAGINLNRRSYRRCTLMTLQKLTLQIVDDTFNKAHKAWDSVVGTHHAENDKRWILDIDDYNPESDVDQKWLKNMEMWIIEECEPFVGKKIIAELPSKSGVHLITRPFNLRTFHSAYPEIEIHKNNPTNLYIP